jgi:hypothetical protein
VRGTDDNDTIAAATLGGNHVWINDGTVVTFSHTDLLLQGRFGNDTYSITPIVGVTITAQGNDPLGSDSAVVNISADTTVAPSADGGTVDMTGAGLVTLTTIEHLKIVGDSGNDTLTIQGNGANHIFVHTPGSVVDSGHVAVDSLVGVSYENLGAAGTVVVDGNGAGNAVLTAQGTAGDDTLDVDATTGDITLGTIAGTHVELQTIDIIAVTLDGLDGNDEFTVNLPQPSYEAVVVLGGSSSPILTSHPMTARLT